MEASTDSSPVPAPARPTVWAPRTLPLKAVNEMCSNSSTTSHFFPRNRIHCISKKAARIHVAQLWTAVHWPIIELKQAVQPLPHPITAPGVAAN